MYLLLTELLIEAWWLNSWCFLEERPCISVTILLAVRHENLQKSIPILLFALFTAQVLLNVLYLAVAVQYRIILIDDWLSFMQSGLDILNVLVARLIHQLLILDVLDEWEEVDLLNYAVAVHIVNIEGELECRGGYLVCWFVLADDLVEELAVECTVVQRHRQIKQGSHFRSDPSGVLALKESFEFLLVYLV